MLWYISFFKNTREDGYILNKVYKFNCDTLFKFLPCIFKVTVVYHKYYKETIV